MTSAQGNVRNEVEPGDTKWLYPATLRCIMCATAIGSTLGMCCNPLLPAVEESLPSRQKARHMSYTPKSVLLYSCLLDKVWEYKTVMALINSLLYS